ncbi:MAG: hypothetical protein WAT23_19995 [Chromatiaceae bacterium]
MFNKMSKSLLLSTLAMISVLMVDLALDAGLIVPKAHAIIGRPLTPLSYAGVARRTSRRMIYATSVYAATLPAGCRTVIIEGTSLHQCGGTYYQTSGSRYVVVRVE